MNRLARDLRIGDVVRFPLGSDRVRKLSQEYGAGNNLRTVHVQWAEAFCWTPMHPDQPLEVFKG